MLSEKEYAQLVIEDLKAIDPDLYKAIQEEIMQDTIRGQDLAAVVYLTDIFKKH